MMQTEIGLPPGEAVRSGQAPLTSNQKQIVDRLLAKHNAPGMSQSEAASFIKDIEDLGSLPVKEATKSEDPEATSREAPKPNRFAPGWPDSPQVMTLASIVSEVLASTDDIPPEEDFTTMLLQKLEEAGLDTSAPIVDFYA